MTAKEIVMTDTESQEEYRKGFVEGFKSARGRYGADPEISAVPVIPNGKKAYDLGWNDGRLHALDATVPDGAK
jgi:hypothetical protein